MIFYFSGVGNSAWVTKEKSPLMGRFFFVGMSLIERSYAPTASDVGLAEVTCA